MCSRCHRNHLLHNIYTYAHTLFINIGKVFCKFFFIKMAAIQKHMLSTCAFHFTVYCSCHYISWCKILSCIDRTLGSETDNRVELVGR